MNGDVISLIKDGICTIEFYHPKGNSLPSTLLKQLAASISEAGNNDAVKVVVLKSGGEGAFCAGASFDELLAIENDTQAMLFFRGFGKVILAMKNCPKSIVGRVHGKAVGGGVGLIAACDYTIAAEQASVKLSELSLGFGPFVIAPAVRRKIGLAAFSALSLQPTQWKSAAWAHQHGLFSEVASDTATLNTAVQQLVEQMAGFSPNAMASIKETLWADFTDYGNSLDDHARLSGNLSQSAFAQSVLKGFKK